MDCHHFRLQALKQTCVKYKEQEQSFLDLGEELDGDQSIWVEVVKRSQLSTVLEGHDILTDDDEQCFLVITTAFMETDTL